MKLKNKEKTVLWIAVLSAIFLLIGRIIQSDTITYTFLVWNLILALVPYLISSYYIQNHAFMNSFKKGFLFLTWFIFFPNAPYIITDFIHLKQKIGIPLWYDILVLLSFTWCGLLLAYLSLRDFHHYFLIFYSKQKVWFLIVIYNFLAAYGIYLGRFERWNSWELFTHPFQLLTKACENLFNEQFYRIAEVTFIFGLVLTVFYFTIYHLTSQSYEKE